LALTVVLEVEYATDSLEEARRLAHRDAVALFRQDDVLAISADAKVGGTPIADREIEKPLPITAMYLADGD
jgi:hypothetical protein